MACPGVRVKPSLGSGPQIVLAAVTCAGLLQTLLVAGIPNPKVFRILLPSHSWPAETPLAMHAAGMVPLELVVDWSKPTSVGTFIWFIQSKLFLQMFSCDVPVPSASRPPNASKKATAL